MQGSLTPQGTSIPPRESQAETHTLPLKTLFEQLQSSEQGLTGEEAHTRFVQRYQDLSSQGYRVLAVAYRSIPPLTTYRKTDEQTLILLGFLTFADPPKPDVAQVLQALKADGVQVKILTGDNELVTRHVYEQVGLDGGSIVLGSELDHMSDTALSQVVERAHVFARVSPVQKNRIILALKHRKHVVGYMGDGINDAPSLHAADVGISVSIAVDVAKDAADVILLEQSLRVLHNGILEGRKAFGNVIKYLLMGTSSNFGDLLSVGPVDQEPCDETLCPIVTHPAPLSFRYFKS